jgi:hypothetical protein
MNKLKQLLDKIKYLLNKLRSIKDNFTKDNYFDGFFGGVLALISLELYFAISWVPFYAILVFPFIFSVINEFINMWQGEKYFSFRDVFLRTIIPLLLFLIVYLNLKK